MGLITPTQVSDGTTADASDINTPIAQIANEFNGNIDNANVKAGAAIDVSKLAQNNGQLAIKPVIAYKFAAYQSSNQSNLVANTWTKLVFQTKEFDTSTNFDATTNYRFTAPVAGFYTFTGSAAFNTGGNGVLCMIALYKNGTEFKRGTQTFGNSTQTDAVIAPPAFSLAANDFIELWAFCGSGVTMLNGQNQTYFGGYLVSV